MLHHIIAATAAAQSFAQYLDRCREMPRTIFHCPVRAQYHRSGHSHRPILQAGMQCRKHLCVQADVRVHHTKELPGRCCERLIVIGGKSLGRGIPMHDDRKGKIAGIKRQRLGQIQRKQYFQWIGLAAPVQISQQCLKQMGLQVADDRNRNRGQYCRQRVLPSLPGFPSMGPRHHIHARNAKSSYTSRPGSTV